MPEFFINANKDFDSYLQSHIVDIKGFHPDLKTAFFEMLLNGGKHFRQRLLFAVVCGSAKDLVLNSLPVGLSIECMHTYSLIHDDLPCMDNADFRRSKPTLHKKYSQSLAVLVGDALNTYSFYLLSNCLLDPSTKIALINALSFNAGINGMILGQALDCHFENQTLELDKLEFLHIRKTGFLIACCLKMGGIIANLNEQFIEFLYEFGLKLGLFFQIRDDIIDFTLDSKKAGKPTNHDSSKNSYVNLLGLQVAKQKLDLLKQELLKDLEEIKEVDSKIFINLNYLLDQYFDI